MTDPVRARRELVKQAEHKSREEIRNMVRIELGRQGFSPSLVKQEALALVDKGTSQALRERLDNGAMGKLMRNIIREEIAKVVGNERDFAAAVKKAIQAEFAVMASQFLDRNVVIKVVDGAGQPNAGSF